MTKPTIIQLNAFSAVATEKSFRKAADKLDVSRSSLSHSISSLENLLGVRLFHRSTRSVTLTDAGLKLVDRLSPIMQNLMAALDEVAGNSTAPTGTLRINANESGARVLLENILPRFIRLYPDINIELVTNGQLIDIFEQGFDAGIRLYNAVPKDMIAVSLAGPSRFVVVASPSYLSSYSTPKVPDDLRNHVCIPQRLPSGKRYRWDFEKHGQEMAIDVDGPLLLDHAGLMVEAAALGLGVAYVSARFAKTYIENGKLVEILGDWCPEIPGLCLYYSGRRHVPVTLRSLIDFVRAQEGHSD